MLYFFLLVAVLTLLVAYLLTRDFLSPAVLFPIPWILATITLVFSDFDYDVSSDVYLMFAVGMFLFELGYFIAHNRIYLSQRIWSDECRIEIKMDAYKVLVAVEVVFTIYLCRRYFLFIVANWRQNFFVTFFSSRDSFNGILIISYIRSIITAITLFSIVMFLFIKESQKQDYVMLLRLQYLIVFISALSRFTRNGVLSALLPVLIATVVVFKQSSKRIFTIFFIAAVAFMVYYSYIATVKYWYVFDNGGFWESLIKQIAVYAASPLVAFQKVVDNKSYELLYGANSFRFFIALVDGILGSHNALPLPQDFIDVGNGVTTNVYTFYYYYLCDFGLVYALFAEFLVGMLHGILYKKMSIKNPLAIYFFSLTIYPLLMQFFQDQYISLFSTWLQFLISGFILFKTNIIIRSRKGDYL